MSFFLMNHITKKKIDTNLVLKNKEIKLREVLAKKNNFINFNLLDPLKNLDNDSLSAFILAFCSKCLLEKWYTQTQSYPQIRTYLHESCWNDYSVRSEMFKRDERYIVEFELNDLMDFLGLSKRSESKNQILSVIRTIMDAKVEFRVNDKFYVQPFIYSLEVCYKRKTPSKITLVIHPYAVHNLLGYIELFDNDLLTTYYNLLDKYKLEKYKLNSKKTHRVLGYFAFIQIFLAYKKKEGSHLLAVFEKRNKKKPLLRQRQIEMLHEFLSYCDQSLDKKLAIAIDNQIHSPVKIELLNKILNNTRDKLLQQVEFLFLDNTKNLNE